ncbi:methionine-R-sulfoxide reductase B3 isoform X2 [Coturnix japonica]|uniref:methionine-R-sulfoxide reductase B3 isoform X2 n=1 Tax=Coturnix japonica TaxID=93934 RepID=UPI000777973E|nr:methionine-R-sulfoxide reductase B3 isoform X2 [Coturnix japonica]
MGMDTAVAQPCSYLALAAGAQEFPVMLPCAAGPSPLSRGAEGGVGAAAAAPSGLPSMRAAPPLLLLSALVLALAAAAGAAGSCRDKKDCKVVFSQEELRKRLTPLQYHVTQEKGTESAFEGEYTHHKAQGIYKCVVCGTPLFKSETKFDSNSGLCALPIAVASFGAARRHALNRPGLSRGYGHSPWTWVQGSPWCGQSACGSWVKQGLRAGSSWGLAGQKLSRHAPIL